MCNNTKKYNYNSITVYIWEENISIWNFGTKTGIAANKEATETRSLIGKLKSSLRKSYGLHHALVERYGISVSQMSTYTFHLS